MAFGFRRQKKTFNKTVSDIKMDAFLKFGKDQLMRLKAKGLNIPVVLL